MTLLTRTVSKLVALAVVIGCTDNAVRPADIPQVVRQAVAGGKVDQDTRANMVWADQVVIDGVDTPSGIRGDDRNKYGQFALPSDEYQGTHCGVRAYIFNGPKQNGTLDFDNDTGWQFTMQSSCGPARKLQLFQNGPENPPLISGPHSTAYGIWQLAAGATRLQGQEFGVQLTGCQRFSFDDAYPPANHVRVTRLPDVTRTDGLVVRQWRIESQGSHRAMCINAGPGGRFTPSGVSYFLPFSVVVTEVPYPFPTYP